MNLYKEMKELNNQEIKELNNQEMKDINYILSNKILKESLIEYCIFLAEKYNETLSGIYRIKYNDLFPILFNYLSQEKKEELFKNFTTSLNINPILKINEDKIKFKVF